MTVIIGNWEEDSLTLFQLPIMAAHVLKQPNGMTRNDACLVDKAVSEPGHSITACPTRQGLLMDCVYTDV